MIAFFHLSVVCLNAFCLWYDQNYMNIPMPKNVETGVPFRGRALFLTMWGLTLQTLYFTLALINDLIGTNVVSPKKPPFIRKLKDTIFSLAFAVALYVALTFWGLYHFDKDLIFPDHVEKEFPRWVNHTMHTTVVIFMLIELLFSSRNYPTRKIGVSICLAFNLTYVAWLLVIYFQWGIWVYPIFEHLNWPQRIAFLVVSASVGLVFYLLGEKITNVLSPSSKISRPGKKTKSR